MPAALISSGYRRLIYVAHKLVHPGRPHRHRLNAELFQARLRGRVRPAPSPPPHAIFRRYRAASSPGRTRRTRSRCRRPSNPISTGVGTSGSSATRLGVSRPRARGTWPSRDQRQRGCERAEIQVMGSFVGKELNPVFGSDTTLDEYIRNTAITLHHPLGTCKMGPDDDGGGGRSAAPGARRRAAAGGRRLGDAGPDQRQHQRAGDHDRREGRRHDPRYADAGAAER